MTLAKENTYDAIELSLRDDEDVVEKQNDDKTIEKNDTTKHSFTNGKFKLPRMLIQKLGFRKGSTKRTYLLAEQQTKSKGNNKNLSNRNGEYPISEAGDKDISTGDCASTDISSRQSSFDKLSGHSTENKDTHDKLMTPPSVESLRTVESIQSNSLGPNSICESYDDETINAIHVDIDENIDQILFWGISTIDDIAEFESQGSGDQTFEQNELASSIENSESLSEEPSQVEDHAMAHEGKTTVRRPLLDVTSNETDKMKKPSPLDVDVTPPGKRSTGKKLSNRLRKLSCIRNRHRSSNEPILFTEFEEEEQNGNSTSERPKKCGRDYNQVQEEDAVVLHPLLPSVHQTIPENSEWLGCGHATTAINESEDPLSSKPGLSIGSLFGPLGSHPDWANDIMCGEDDDSLYLSSLESETTVYTKDSETFSKSLDWMSPCVYLGGSALRASPNDQGRRSKASHGSQNKADGDCLGIVCWNDIPQSYFDKIRTAGMSKSSLPEVINIGACALRPISPLRNPTRKNSKREFKEDEPSPDDSDTAVESLEFSLKEFAEYADASKRRSRSRVFPHGFRDLLGQKWKNSRSDVLLKDISPDFGNLENDAHPIASASSEFDSNSVAESIQTSVKLDDKSNTRGTDDDEYVKMLERWLMDGFTVSNFSIEAADCIKDTTNDLFKEPEAEQNEHTTKDSVSNRADSAVTEEEDHIKVNSKEANCSINNAMACHTLSDVTGCVDLKGQCHRVKNSDTRDQDKKSKQTSSKENDNGEEENVALDDDIEHSLEKSSKVVRNLGWRHRWTKLSRSFSKKSEVVNANKRPLTTGIMKQPDTQEGLDAKKPSDVNMVQKGAPQKQSRRNLDLLSDEEVSKLFDQILKEDATNNMPKKDTFHGSTTGDENKVATPEDVGGYLVRKHRSNMGSRHRVPSNLSKGETSDKKRIRNASDIHLPKKEGSIKKLSTRNSDDCQEPVRRRRQVRTGRESSKTDFFTKERNHGVKIGYERDNNSTNYFKERQKNEIKNYPFNTKSRNRSYDNSTTPTTDDSTATESTADSSVLLNNEPTDSILVELFNDAVNCGNETTASHVVEDNVSRTGVVSHHFGGDTGLNSKKSTEDDYYLTETNIFFPKATKSTNNENESNRGQTVKTSETVVLQFRKPRKKKSPTPTTSSEDSNVDDTVELKKDKSPPSSSPDVDELEKNKLRSSSDERSDKEESLTSSPVRASFAMNIGAAAVTFVEPDAITGKSDDASRDEDGYSTSSKQNKNNDQWENVRLSSSSSYEETIISQTGWENFSNNMDEATDSSVRSLSSKSSRQRSNITTPSVRMPSPSWINENHQQQFQHSFPYVAPTTLPTGVAQIE